MKKELEDRIIAHGNNLLKVFPDATEKDPVKLCKKLRKIEVEANNFATDRCNGVPPNMPEETEDKIIADFLKKVAALLGKRGPKVFLNLDCRGYALKIDSENMDREWVMGGFHCDWGGNGIIAPDLR